MKVRNLFAALLFSFAAWAAEPGSALRTVAGSDFAGDGGSAQNAQFRQIEGIAVDTRGNVYLADAADQRVRRISADGSVSTIAGDGHPGFRGDGGPALQSQLRSPYGLALDPTGNLYIADLGNARIRKVLTDGRITSVATSAPFIAPRNVAVDSSGVLYVSDFGAHRVYRILSSGEFSVVAGTGSPGYGGDGALATQSQLRSPAGIALAPNGTLYIADSGNRRIRSVARGIMETVGVAGMPGFVFPIPLYGPTGVAVDQAGTLFIADGEQALRMPLLGNPKVLPATGRDIAIDAGGNIYTTSGNAALKIGGAVVSTLASTAAYGYFSEGIAALNARFQQPNGVAADGSGNVYIADERNHRVRKVSATGVVTTLAVVDSPSGIAADAAGDVFFSDAATQRIHKLTASGASVVIAGSGVKGFSGDGGLAISARFDTPTGLWLDPAGNLFVADTGNQRIRKITPFGLISTVAAVGLNRPRGVSGDSEGNLYIADTGNNLIRKVTSDGIVSTVMENLNAPCGVLVDGAGAVYVADTGFHRVRKIFPGGDAFTIAGTAEEGFNGESGAALSMQLSYPSGLAFDADGNLLVSDTGNNRVRLLSGDLAVSEPLRSVRVLHAATSSGGPFAPGQLIVVEGLAVPAEASATFDGTPGRVIGVEQNRLMLLVPVEFVGRPATTLRIGDFVRELELVSAAPGILANGTARNGARGSLIMMLATGEGVEAQSLAVTIAGVPAEILSTTSALGMLQLQVRVPQDAPTGDGELLLHVGAAVSQSGISLTVE